MAVWVRMMVMRMPVRMAVPVGCSLLFILFLCLV